MRFLIIVLIFTAFNANAFYTSFEQDLEVLRKSIEKQEGTMLQKQQFLEKIIPSVRKARYEAYSRVSSECTKDLKKLCKGKTTLDDKVKCLSENNRLLSDTCNFAIINNFRKVD